MRASRILQARPERAILALAQLCEERKDETLGPPPPQSRSAGPPRLASVPPQTPYTIGSSPMRVPVPAPEEISSRKLAQVSSPTSPTPSSPSDSPGPLTAAKEVPLRLPVDKLDHMAPIRSKWTSPPPPEAPEEDRSAYEDRLGQSLAFATVSRGLRPREYSYASSNNSDIVTDDERQSIAESDDVRSVQSFVEEGAVHYSREYRERERQLASLHAQQAALQQRLQQQYGIDPSSSGLNGGLPIGSRLEGGVDIKMISRLRGRPAARVVQQVHSSNLGGGRATPSDENTGFTPPPRMDSHTPRRSMSFPVRNPNRFSLPAMSMVATNPLAATYQTHLSPTVGQMSPRYVLQAAAEAQAQANVYYEAIPPRERMYRAAGSYSSFGSPDMSLDEEEALHSRAFARLRGNGSRSPSRSPPESGRESPIVIRRTKSTQSDGVEEPVAGPSRLPIDAPVPTSPHLEQGRGERMYSHHHSHSNATITAPTPPANVHHFSVPISIPMSTPLGNTLGPRHSNPQSQSRSRSPPFLPTQRNPPHPYTYPTQYPSPRMGAANLPPRLRADRERSLGFAGHVGVQDQRVLSAHAQAQTDVLQHAHARLRSSSPFASHSLSSGSASPPMSCTSSQYAPSSSPLSTSPPSPARSDLKSERGSGNVGVVSPLRSPIPLLDDTAALPDVQELHEKIGADTPVPVVVTPAPASSPVPTVSEAPSAAPAVSQSQQQTEPRPTGARPSEEAKIELVEPRLPVPTPLRSDSIETVTDEVKHERTTGTPQVLVTESSPVVEREPESVPEESKP